MTGIERLNACFLEFPEQTKDLLHHMIPCPDGMERHVLHRVIPDGSKAVTTIGLLNGTLFRRGRRLAYEVAKDEYRSRFEELADIQGYSLIPAERFHETEPDGAGSILAAPAPEAPAARKNLSFEAALPFVRERKRIGRSGWHGEFYVEIMRGEMMLFDGTHGLPAVWMGVWSDMLALDWEVVS